MKNKVMDKLYLILTGFLILLFYLLSDILLGKFLPKKWIDFVVACIAYLIILVYGTSTLKEFFKRGAKMKVFLFQGTCYIVTVGIAFLGLQLGIVPFPENHHVYAAAIITLSICAGMVLLLLIKKTNFINRDK